MPVVAAWLVDNSHWIIPVASTVWSEYLGYKSGNPKASISGTLWDLVLKLVALVKPK